MSSPPGRLWRTPTGTGQTSACGSMTKVGQAANTCGINRCLGETNHDLSNNMKRWIHQKGPEGIPSLRLLPEMDTQWI